MLKIVYRGTEMSAEETVRLYQEEGMINEPEFVGWLSNVLAESKITGLEEELIADVKQEILRKVTASIKSAYMQEHPREKGRPRKEYAHQVEKYLSSKECQTVISNQVEEKFGKKIKESGGTIKLSSPADQYAADKLSQDCLRCVREHNAKIQKEHDNKMIEWFKRTGLEHVFTEKSAELTEKLQKMIDDYIVNLEEFPEWEDDDEYYDPEDSMYWTPLFPDNGHKEETLEDQIDHFSGQMEEFWVDTEVADQITGEATIASFILAYLAEPFAPVSEGTLSDLMEEYDWELSEYEEEVSQSLDLSSEHILLLLKENIHFPGISPTVDYILRRDEILNREREARKKRKAQRKKEEKARNDMIRKSILHAMPDNYPDLYPLARSIKRKFVLHIGPTNSGKTYSAMQALRKKGGIYLAPLRLLAFEQYEQLNADGIPCSLITGEERSIIEGAQVQASTVEMAEMAKEYPAAVIDEAQMISDKDRGWAWTAAVLGLYCGEIHVCAAPHAESILKSLITECGDSYEVIRHERKAPLVVQDIPFSFPKGIRKNDALIVFSKRNVHAVAYELRNKGYKVSVIYGNLPYDVRQSEAKKFAEGETDVLVATDAIGMGLNLPVKRIVFLESAKYDGVRRRDLTADEVQQIAGRAGRINIFDEGECCICGRTSFLKERMSDMVKPVTQAVIGFPDALLGIDADLSEILGQWKRMPASDGYTVMDTDTMERLTRQLEARTDDKMLIYQLVTIPFNEKTEKELWDFLADKEIRNETVSFHDADQVFGITRCGDSLDNMERAYKQCDLLYSYFTRFGHTEFTEEVLAWKQELSRRIIKSLEKGLSPRKCKYCGRVMPWNYPYGMCQKCHDSMYDRGPWEWDF